jgi:hypothetical protein
MTTPSQGSEVRAVRRSNRVFVLPGLEVHDWNGVAADKLFDGRHESIVHRLEQRRRRDRIAEIITQEVAEAAGRLQLGHVRVQIQPVEAPHFERDVVTDNIGDVGRHRTLLGGKVDDGTPPGARRSCIGPNIKRPRSGRTLKVRRNPEGAETERPQRASRWSRTLTRRFEAKLHCWPVQNDAVLVLCGAIWR